MKKRISPQTRLALICGVSLTALCVLFALIIAFAAAHPDPTPQTATIRNPLDGAQDGVSMLLRADQGNDEYFAANHFPTLLGAKGDGVSNDTGPLQESLAHAGEIGGTVYLPQGIYRITEPLTIPANVTLRGDFSAPNSNLSDGGNTILLVADNKKMQQSPFLTLENGASLTGITVYYEKQTPEKIIEYPATVYCSGANSIQQVTLLNPYHGICITGSGAVTVRSVWMSPLDYGILITDNNDAVTLEDCQISPTYWLNYAPAVFSDGKGYSALTGYLHEKMHGVILEKVNDVTLHRISVEDAAVGILYNIPKEQDSILLTKEINISYTHRPLYVQSLPKAGICIESSTLRPENDAGANTVEICETVEAPVIFSNCTFGGLPKTVVKADNHSFVSFYHCNFGTWWNVCFDMENDTFLAVSPIFKSANEKANLGKNALGLFYNAPSIEESSQLLFSVSAGDAKIIDTDSVAGLKDTQRTFTNKPIINALSYGVSPQSKDNSEALQAALTEAEKSQATVFLPEGVYKFQSIVTVPDSVRLIGVGSSGEYSTVLSFELQRQTNLSLVELLPGASVEDLEIRQDQISSESEKTYAVSSLYPDVRIRRVSITANRGIWLTSAGYATIEHVNATVTQTGIYLQDMKNVTLRDVTVTSSSQAYDTVGILLENTSATMSNLRGEFLSKTLELTGKTDLSATLIALRDTTVGIQTNHTGTALLTCIGFSGAGQGGNTLFLQGMEDATGSITLQGIIGGGSALLGNMVSAENGEIELRAGIFTTPFSTTVHAERDANITVYGCIWDTNPTYHATATGGTVSLAAKLLRSDKTFEGIEGNYMLTSTGTEDEDDEDSEDGGKIEDDVNVIQHTYVYVEPEDPIDPDQNQTQQPEEN